MKRIEKLTEEQTRKISEYRERFFRMATSTEPCDMERAKKAALRLAEIGGLKNCEVKIAENPQGGNSLWNSLGDSLWNSLGDSLWNSLWNSLSNSLRNSLGDSLWNSLGNSLSNSLSNSLRDSLSNSLRNSLWNSLSNSLSNSLRDSLSNSLSNSLRDSLSNSLRNSLSNSLWNSPWDSSWTAFYSYAVEELEIECSDEHRELLSLYREIAENCTAVWMLPGTIIICEKPKLVEVKDGKLVNIEWGEGSAK